jgi:hypothetical protein
MPNDSTYWTKQSTRRGTCPTHGSVNATKTVPNPHFPYVVFAVRKLAGVFRPYRCPACGAKA